MPPKKDQYSGVSEKAIKLFAKLLFYRKEYSLSELARLLDTSKQTILRLISEIENVYEIRIDTEIKNNRQKYYSIKQLRGTKPMLPLSIDELTFLQMCRIFTGHLIGGEMFNDMENTIDKCCNFLSSENEEPINLDIFENITFGTIDYTPFSSTIKTLMNAIKNRYLVEVNYKKITNAQGKTSVVMPIKLFARKDTIYLFARLKDAIDEKGDRLYTIHRILDAKQLKEKFIYPKDIDLKKIFNSFGVMTGEPFTVKARLSGKPAFYVSERILSPDQNITWLNDDTMEISFTAQSKDEVLSWSMAFGAKAQILEPLWLRDEIKKELTEAAIIYSEEV
jgi:predicted DNA-binding transcriptional regulator YafY